MGITAQTSICVCKSLSMYVHFHLPYCGLLLTLAHPPGCFSCWNVPLWAVTCRRYVAGVCSNSYQVRGLLCQLWDISHLLTLDVFTFTVSWWDYQIVSRFGLAWVVSRRTPLSQSRDPPHHQVRLSLADCLGSAWALRVAHVGPGLRSKIIPDWMLWSWTCDWPHPQTSWPLSDNS